MAELRLGSPLARVRLEAPIPRPARNIFCLGRNDKEHAAERGAEAPPHPVYFTKVPQSALPPGGKIVHRSVTKELDYEVELTVVIGTAGHDVRREQALAHVFGYTVISDVTARDLQKRHGQWFKGETLDTFCPSVNGETRQSSHTSKMIFPVDECISVLSEGFATGTPEGVGAATGKFLKAGDKIEAEVEKIGVLANGVVAPPNDEAE